MRLCSWASAPGLHQLYRQSQPPRRRLPRPLPAQTKSQVEDCNTAAPAGPTCRCDRPAANQISDASSRLRPAPLAIRSPQARTSTQQAAASRLQTGKPVHGEPAPSHLSYPCAYGSDKPGRSSRWELRTLTKKLQTRRKKSREVWVMISYTESDEEWGQVTRVRISHLQRHRSRAVSLTWKTTRTGMRPQILLSRHYFAARVSGTNQLAT
jgi:hypothetical protein